jgi:hypothetical protein
LCVLPRAQRRGVGKNLLQVAQSAFDRLQLWTCQRNAPALRFYEARGFALVQDTDGARNEEKEPDVLYLWSADRLMGRSCMQGQRRKGSACLMLAMGSATSPKACNISANARPTKAALVETIMQNRIGLA